MTYKGGEMSLMKEGKTTLNAPDQALNLDLPITVYCEPDAPDHVSTRVGMEENEEEKGIDNIDQKCPFYNLTPPPEATTAENFHLYAGAPKKRSSPGVKFTSGPPFPVVGSLVYCESSSLDHAAIESGCRRIIDE
uniref:Uncharacterized protein n=1 Tax=Timema cristinae TaxID=61476 RepID=A0A7R9H2P1_TIMCR|nr:unnamed protein product [Timema cristinae]